MKTETLLGTALYQAETIPKRARVSQRIDMTCMAEFTVRRIDPKATVENAVIATGFFEGDLGRPGRERPVPQSYLGYDGALWQPLLVNRPDGIGSITFDDFRRRLQLPPTHNVRGALTDPTMEADDPETGFARHAYDRGKYLRDEASFAGHISWTNKARAVAIQQEATKRLLLVVGDTVFRRSRGPVWSVTDGSGFDLYQGSVLLRQGDRCDEAGDAFAPNKLDLARTWCQQRWGKCVVSGLIERLDARFIDGLEGARLVERRLQKLLDKGLSFIPYWPAEAVDSFLALSRELTISKPLRIFGVRDPNTARTLAASLRPHVAAPSVPTSLRNTAKDILSDLYRIDNLARFDPSLFVDLNAEQEAGLETTMVAP